MLIRNKVRPYYSVAKQMLAAVMADNGRPSWSGVEWQRRLEILKNYLCMQWCTMLLIAIFSSTGKLTDGGRQTTLSTGRRLRHLM